MREHFTLIWRAHKRNVLFGLALELEVVVHPTLNTDPTECERAIREVYEDPRALLTHYPSMDSTPDGQPNFGVRS